MASSRRSPGSGHGVGVMFAQVVLQFLARALPPLLALFCEQDSHHICQSLAAAPHIYLALPISLNSLDREGARLLSPCGSQITITPDAGPDDSAPGDALELKWEFDEDSQCYYVSFPDDQQWCPVGGDRDRVACWVIFYFGAVVGP